MPIDQVLVTDFENGANSEFKKIIERIVEIVENSGSDLDTAVKWKQLTFAIRGDFHHWICSIKKTKKFIGLNFHYGGLLDDKTNSFSVGTSRFLRKIEYRTLADVKEGVIQDFIAQALSKHQYFKDNWKELQKAK